MSAIQISKDVYWVGVKDPDLRVFDIIMATEHGTTYNAYLIKGENKTALIDTVKEGFTEEYFANIEDIVPLDSIDYLVVNHTEPDHSGAMHTLLDRLPNLEIVCGTAALPFVRNVLNREANITTVKDNVEIDLGGKTLVFKLMPYMHWPDTMMEFLVEDKILFSCDGFAAHLAWENIFADECKFDFEHEMEYYYDAIMRPFASYIRRNMPKLDDLDIQMIAPSHGPLIRRVVRSYLDRYNEWAADKTEGKKQVAIVYVSSYGNTARIAEGLADKLTAKGWTPVMVNAADFDVEETRNVLEASKAIMFGTPTFAGDAVRPTWDVVNLLSTIPTKETKTAVFGSFGWGGEGVKLVQARLDGMKMKVFEEIFKIRLVPSDDDMAGLDDYVERLVAYFEA